MLPVPLIPNPSTQLSSSSSIHPHSCHLKPPSTLPKIDSGTNTSVLRTFTSTPSQSHPFYSCPPPHRHLSLACIPTQRHSVCPSTPPARTPSYPLFRFTSRTFSIPPFTSIFISHLFIFSSTPPLFLPPCLPVSILIPSPSPSIPFPLISSFLMPLPAPYTPTHFPITQTLPSTTRKALVRKPGRYLPTTISTVYFEARSKVAWRTWGTMKTEQGWSEQLSGQRGRLREVAVYSVAGGRHLFADSWKEGLSVYMTGSGRSSNGTMLFSGFILATVYLMWNMHSTLHLSPSHPLHNQAHLIPSP